MLDLGMSLHPPPDSSAGLTNSRPLSAVGSDGRRSVKNASVEGPTLKLVQEIISSEISNFKAAIDLMLDQIAAKVQEDVAQCEDHLRQCLDSDRKRFEEALVAVRQEVQQSRSYTGIVGDGTNIASLKQGVNAAHIGDLKQSVSVMEASLADLKREFTTQSGQLQLQCEGVRSELEARCLGMTSRLVEIECAVAGLERDTTNRTSSQSEWADQREVFSSEVRAAFQCQELQDTHCADGQMQKLERWLESVMRENLDATVFRAENNASVCAELQSEMATCAERNASTSQRVCDAENRLNMMQSALNNSVPLTEFAEVRKELQTRIESHHVQMIVAVKQIAEELVTMCSQLEIYVASKTKQEVAHSQTEMAVCAAKIAAIDESIFEVRSAASGNDRCVKEIDDKIKAGFVYVESHFKQEFDAITRKASELATQLCMEFPSHIHNIEARGPDAEQDMGLLQRDCEEIADQHTEATSQLDARSSATECHIHKIEENLQEAFLSKLIRSPPSQTQIDCALNETRMELQNKMYGFEVMASAAEQSINTVLQNFETVSRQHSEMISYIEEFRLQNAATERRMEEIEGKIGATFPLDNASCTQPSSTTVVQTSAEPTISGLPGELRILELERRFEEVVMENSENIVLLHALKKEIRKEVGQHVRHPGEEVKRHLTGAEDFHKDMKYRIGGVEVELRPLAREVEALRGSTKQAALAMQEPMEYTEFSTDSMPPQFLTDEVRAKLERLVHGVGSTFRQGDAVHVR